MAVQLVLPPRTIGLVLIISAVIMVGALGYIYLPHVKIVVAPKITTHEISQDVLVSVKAQEPDFVRFVLPAKVVEADISASRIFSRPSAQTSEDYSRGTVVFHNNQSEDQQLLPKTNLRHEATNVFFLTDSPVRIPANGTTAITVTAKEKGAAGNVPAGKFIVDKLPAPLQSQIWAESSQNFSGGVAADAPITQEEIDRARQELRDQAQTEALGKLTTQSGGAPVSPDLTQLELVSENISAQPGSRSTEYEIAMQLKAKGVILDSNDLLSLALLALRNKQSADEEFIEYQPESFRYAIKRADFNAGEILINTQLRGDFGTKIGASSLSAANIAGLSEPEIIDHFKRMANVETVEVSFSPFWVKTAPSRTKAIEIVIKDVN